MLTLVAFLVALALLIAIHEYGHYQVARWCGVKVLRFSIGFGKPLVRWQRNQQDTEFVLCALPLGGYVKMLDERESPVAPDERHLAFNTQSVWKRFAIVAAGPVANLLLAILLYAAVAWHGVPEAQPIVAEPPVGSLAAQAGVRSGDIVRSLRSVSDDVAQPVNSLEQLRWELAQAALNHEDVELQVQRGAGGSVASVLLPLQQAAFAEAGSDVLDQIGMTTPWMPALVGELVSAQAADKAGLKKGDLVLRVGNVRIQDAVQLRRLIRASTSGQTQTWEIRRAEALLTVPVTPETVEQGGITVGRIGAYLGASPAMTTVRYGLWQGLMQGVQRTWEVSILSLKMMGRVVIGQASLKNISGPLTIADYAGRSAQAGMVSYVLFLALISVSLGVLNLLPIPVLDGGHLMYYLWEAATGRPVTDQWMERLQRVGLALLATMMVVALFNDISRLFA